MVEVFAPVSVADRLAPVSLGVVAVGRAAGVVPVPLPVEVGFLPVLCFFLVPDGVVVVGVVVVGVRVGVVSATNVSSTNSVVLVPLVLNVVADESEPEPEPELDDVPSSAEVRLSLAAVRLSSAWSRARSAEVGTSVASSCPLLTCWPTLTSTDWRVPLVAKLTAWSVAGSTLPVPETVVWTTPSSAWTVSLEVRAELVGGPICVIAMTTITAATAASRYRGHEVAKRDERGVTVS